MDNDDDVLMNSVSGMRDDPAHSEMSGSSVIHLQAISPKSGLQVGVAYFITAERAYLGAMVQEDIERKTFEDRGNTPDTRGTGAPSRRVLWPGLVSARMLVRSGAQSALRSPDSAKGS